MSKIKFEKSIISLITIINGIFNVRKNDKIVSKIQLFDTILSRNDIKLSQNDRNLSQNDRKFSQNTLILIKHFLEIPLNKITIPFIGMNTSYIINLSPEKSIPHLPELERDITNKKFRFPFNIFLPF